MKTEAEKMKLLLLAAEHRDWSVRIMEESSEKCVEYESWSPAGEDIVFAVHYEDAVDLCRKVRDYAQAFDAEEHVTDLIIAKRNGFTGVPDIKTLVEDADAIQGMLASLADTLERMLDSSWYTVVDSQGAAKIIDNREPLGRFLHKDGGVFVGIDNSDGNAWTEEFKTEAECLLWLAGEMEVNAE